MRREAIGIVSSEAMTRSKGGEMEKRWPEIRLAVKELSLLQHEDQKAPTMAFLCVSKLLVNVLGLFFILFPTSFALFDVWEVRLPDW